MSVLTGCFGCFGPTSGLEEGVLFLLEEYNLTRCVVRARTTGFRLGESPYGIVDEVGFYYQACRHIHTAPNLK
jgi:hypothetical protein